jgi:glutathione S-transferase
VNQWCDFICQHLGVHYTRVSYNKLFAEKMGDEKDERAITEAYKFIDRFLLFIEGQLNKTKYLAGDSLTIADLSLLAEIDPSELNEVDLKKYPKIHTLVQQLRSEEFHQNVNKFYGEYLAKV